MKTNAEAVLSGAVQGPDAGATLTVLKLSFFANELLRVE